MGVWVNVHMSKIMRTPIKLGVSMYAMYANCRTLDGKHNAKVRTVI